MQLSVEVPGNREEENHAELDMDQENEEPRISLNVQDGDDERSKYGLNSPKQQNKNNTDMEDDDEGAMTPATKLRQTAGINSPKQPTAMTWGNTEENKNNPLASLITQVSRDDNHQKNKSGVESLITQVSRGDVQPIAHVPSDEEDDPNHIKTTPAQNAGICACLSTLFTCCSTSTTEQHTAKQIYSQAKNVSKLELQQINPPATQNKSAGQTNTEGNEANTEENDPNPTHETEDNQDQEEGNQDQEDYTPGQDGNAPVQVENNQEEEEEIEEQTEDDGNESSNSQESSTDYHAALLPPLSPDNKGKRCLVLDLDETLVHSSFKPVPSCDFIIPVEIDGVVHRVYVLKRPFVDEFLLECSKSYEIVIFTASLSKYADPLLDQLDFQRVVSHRLFRESCTLHGSAYVKDMRKMGRRLKDTIIVDNSPHSYCFQPKNAVPIGTWFDDKTDTQLRDFIPVLNTTLLTVKDVRNVLDAHNKSFDWLCQQANVDISKFEPNTKKNKTK